jgi:hypothetical protein
VGGESKREKGREEGKEGEEVEMGESASYFTMNEYLFEKCVVK